MSRRLRLPAQCGGDSSVASDATATRNYATVTEDAAPTESAARRADDVLTVNLAVVCNGFLLCTIYYFANIIIDDLRDHGSFTIDLSILRPTTLTLFFALWFMCNASLIVGNLGFRCWRSGRTIILNLQFLAVCWDWSWSAAAVLLHVAMVVVPVLVCHQRGLHGVITFALTVEQMRLLMKSIDYLCEHVRSALMAKPTNDSITHLLLFMNAPTFIYKDNYKRTRCVRLLPALGHACVLVLSSITMVTMVERSLRGVSLLLASYWITTIRMAPVGLVLLMGSAIVLYSASAMSAELLRFPTDGIVQAWWNVSSFGAFLGNWNLIVKAWLSKYAFKPMLRRGYSVTASKLATILLSAIGHEFVLVGTLGFVIPYVAFLYVFGTAFLIWDPLGVQLKKRGNFATLLLISLGVGMVITFYATENVARKRCPSTTVTGSALWAVFEAEGLTVDQQLRAILEVTNYDNLTMCSQIFAMEIAGIEKFMQNTLPELIDKSEFQKYYGIFSKKPEKFKIVCANLKALNLIQMLAKRLLTANSNPLDKPVGDQLSSSPPHSFRPSSNGSKDKKHEPTEADKLLDYQKILDSSIKGYIQKVYVGAFEVQSAVAQDGLGSFIAKVKCIACDKEIKVTRNNARWNTSNYYAHLQTHCPTAD